MRLHRLQAGDENDEAHHQRQNRPANEKIGKRFHLELRSAIDRVRIHLRFRSEIIVDRDRHSVAQLEDARAHDGFARLQSLVDRNKIAARFAHADELLPDRL